MHLEPLVWAATGVLILAGVAGVVLPLVPGPILILAAALLHTLALPGYVSWWTVAGLAVLAAVELGVSALGSFIGATWAGASRWGLVGAAAGMLAGLYFGPPGIVIGALAGAVIAEMAFAKRTFKEAAKAAVGAGVGMAASMATRLALALLMAAVLLADLFLI